MTINTHTDDQDLGGSEMDTCPSQSATAIAPVPDVADQALMKQSDYIMGITTTFEEAVDLNHRRLPGQLTPVGLILPDDLSHEQWVATIETLKGIDKSRAWWWGDVLNFGEGKYGEMYEQALAATGLSYHHLNHAKQVASRFEFSRRRLNLSWAHHQEVAPISDDVAQDELLDEAEKNGWSQKALRAVIRDRYPPKTGAKLPQGRRAPAKGAPEADERAENGLDRVAAPPAQEQVLAINAAVDCSSAPLIEEVAPEEDGDRPIEAERAGDSVITMYGIANGEIACSETADAAVDNGNDAAALHGADGKQGRTDAMTEPAGMATAGEAKKPLKTPDPEEREDLGQEVAQVCRHVPEKVATSVQLQIYPDADPYCNKAPLWVRGALQSIGPLTQELSTLEHIPNCNRITELVLQLIDALAPVCLENPIQEEKRGKIVNLLQYCGYKNFADQLSRHWLELDETEARHDGAQPGMFDGSSDDVESPTIP